MPHTIEFDESRKRVTIVVAPPVALQGALTCFRTVRLDPRFSAGYAILLNSLAADRPPTHDEGIALGGVLGNFFPGQKLAWVRHNPPRNPGIEALRGIAGLKVRIEQFSDLEAAEAWLGS